jgi:hypothetical protein
MTAQVHEKLWLEGKETSMASHQIIHTLSN